MFDLGTARLVTARELGGLIDLADGIDDIGWQRPTRCDEWLVRDLCAHAGLAATQQAEAFRRATKGIVEPPDYPGAPELSGPEILDLLRGAAHELDAALSDLDDTVLAAVTPLPLGVLPTAVAIQIPVYEYAIHHDDLAAALLHPHELPTDVAAGLVTFFPGLAPMLAGRARPGHSPHAYQLIAPAGTMTIEPRDGHWFVTETTPTLPLCTISGPNDAIALFAMGRITASDQRLKINGPAAAAATDFKRWIPGP